MWRVEGENERSRRTSGEYLERPANTENVRRTRRMGGVVGDEEGGRKTSAG